MKTFTTVLTKIVPTLLGCFCGIFLSFNCSAAEVGLSSSALSSFNAAGDFGLLSRGIYYTSSDAPSAYDVFTYDFSLDGYNAYCSKLSSFGLDTPSYFEYLQNQYYTKLDDMNSYSADCMSIVSNDFNINTGAVNIDSDNNISSDSPIFYSGICRYLNDKLNILSSDLTDDYTVFSSSVLKTVPITMTYNNRTHSLSLASSSAPVYLCVLPSVYGSNAVLVSSSFASLNDYYSFYNTTSKLSLSSTSYGFYSATISFGSNFASDNPYNLPSFANWLEVSNAFTSGIFSGSSSQGGFSALVSSDDESAFLDNSSVTDSDLQFSSVLSSYSLLSDLLGTYDLNSSGAIVIDDTSAISQAFSKATDIDNTIALDDAVSTDIASTVPEVVPSDITVDSPYAQQLQQLYLVPGNLFNDIFRPYFDCFGNFSVYSWWVIFPTLFIIMIIVKIILYLF